MLFVPGDFVFSLGMARVSDCGQHVDRRAKRKKTSYMFMASSEHITPKENIYFWITLWMANGNDFGRWCGILILSFCFLENLEKVFERLSAYCGWHIHDLWRSIKTLKKWNTVPEKGKARPMHFGEKSPLSRTSDSNEKMNCDAQWTAKQKTKTKNENMRKATRT